MVPLGLQSLKSWTAVKLCTIKEEYLVIQKMEKFKDTKVEIHTDKEPSIAIIPFKNEADEDVFYAYGISADLISDCSSAGLIRVSKAFKM